MSIEPQARTRSSSAGPIRRWRKRERGRLAQTSMERRQKVTVQRSAASDRAIEQRSSGTRFLPEAQLAGDEEELRSAKCGYFDRLLPEEQDGRSSRWNCCHW